MTNTIRTTTNDDYYEPYGTLGVGCFMVISESKSRAKKKKIPFGFVLPTNKVK